MDKPEILSAEENQCEFCPLWDGRLGCTHEGAHDGKPVEGCCHFKDLILPLLEKYSTARIAEAVVICHRRTDGSCSTWDFCTHYYPHIKGAACACGICQPYDKDTAMAHQEEIKNKVIAEARKELLAEIELPCADEGHTRFGRPLRECYICMQHFSEQLKQKGG